jgi:hypothetical protein
MVPMQKYNTKEEKMDNNAAMSVALSMPNRRKKLRSHISIFILTVELPNIRSLPSQSQSHRHYGATHTLQP